VISVKVLVLKQEVPESWGSLVPYEPPPAEPSPPSEPSLLEQEREMGPVTREWGGGLVSRGLNRPTDLDALLNPESQSQIGRGAFKQVGSFGPRFVEKVGTHEWKDMAISEALRRLGYPYLPDEPLYTTNREYYSINPHIPSSVQQPIRYVSRQPKLDTPHITHGMGAAYGDRSRVQGERAESMDSLESDVERRKDPTIRSLGTADVRPANIGFDPFTGKAIAFDPQFASDPAVMSGLFSGPVIRDWRGKDLFSPYIEGLHPEEREKRAQRTHEQAEGYSDISPHSSRYLDPDRLAEVERNLPGRNFFSPWIQTALDADEKHMEYEKTLPVRIDPSPIPGMVFADGKLMTQEEADGLSPKRVEHIPDFSFDHNRPLQDWAEYQKWRRDMRNNIKLLQSLRADPAQVRLYEYLMGDKHRREGLPKLDWD